MDNKILIKRNILNSLIEHLKKKEITLIVGARQVGKTTLMYLMKEYIEKKGKKTLFLSLDFESDQKYFISQKDLINKLNLELGKEGGYVFIDEIQRKENAGLFLKGIYDKNLPHKFIVSGSGSLELKEKIHESLAGRKIIYEIPSISFLEFVNFKTNYRYEKNIADYFKIEKIQVIDYLKEYLNFGGYPRVILENTEEGKRRLINEIYQSYMEKDISYLLKVEKLDAFRSLVKLLSSQTGSIINYSELANTLGISLATIHNYILYLEKTFVIVKLAPYFKNIRKEISKSPMIYFSDLGLRNYASGNFGRLETPNDYGFVFQNFIFNIIKQKTFPQNTKISFWRTTDKAEVDFIIDNSKDIMPAEVKFSDFKKPRVERSLQSFIKKYQPQKALIVTKNYKEKLKVYNTEVLFIPFWELIIKKI